MKENTRHIIDLLHDLSITRRDESPSFKCDHPAMMYGPPVDHITTMLEAIA